MKGLTCHIAFDLLSLERDKREAKCQVIRVTHPHMHTQTETERDECFIINPKPTRHSLDINRKLSIPVKTIVTGGTCSVWQPQDFHVLFCKCACSCCWAPVSPQTC